MIKTIVFKNQSHLTHSFNQPPTPSTRIKEVWGKELWR